MISGFRQFEYAQTAMKYGVKYYLLKPIEEDKVVEIMEEIRSGIEERLREAGYQRSLEKQIADGGINEETSYVAKKAILKPLIPMSKEG